MQKYFRGRDKRGRALFGNKDHAEVIGGKRQNEKFVRIPIHINEDIITAREKINTGWRNFLSGGDSMIAMIGFVFEYTCDQTYKKIDENWYRLVSCNFDNGISAFEAGAEFSFGEGMEQ